MGLAFESRGEKEESRGAESIHYDQVEDVRNESNHRTPIWCLRKLLDGGVGGGRNHTSGVRGVRSVIRVVAV